jgi:purine-binding chemotaxis protein CheW
LDSTTSTPDAVSSPTLLFRVGGRLYGCDIRDSQEIIPLRPMTRLPGAPPFVRGLINMRGTIVTVLDLGVRLDPTSGPTRDGSILLVRHGAHGERIAGLVVEEVADVRVLDVEAADPSQAGGAGAIVKGVAAIDTDGGDGEAVVVLDLDVLIKQVLL